MIFDKNLKTINIGDSIYFSCGELSYEAYVYEIDDDSIYYIKFVDGYPQFNWLNRLECSRYVTLK